MDGVILRDEKRLKRVHEGTLSHSDGDISDL